MSLEEVNGEVKHLPKRRDVFEFDSEVAACFDSMALRSIPLYTEVHRLHLSLFRHLLGFGSTVVDVGSSTGQLFRAIEAVLGFPLARAGVQAIAIDTSQPMMDRLLTTFPGVKGVVADVADMPDLDTPAEFMAAFYVLQFIPDDRKLKALNWMLRNLMVGGVLVLGQKDTITSAPLRELCDEEYYKFRRDNGYTQAEIDIKTAALKNSMWTISHEQLANMLRMSPIHVDFVETSRWLQFSTVACIRRA